MFDDTPIHSKRGASTTSVPCDPAAPAHAVQSPGAPILRSWPLLLAILDLTDPTAASLDPSCLLCAAQHSHTASPVIHGHRGPMSLASPRRPRRLCSRMRICGTRASNRLLSAHAQVPKPYAPISESAAPLRRSCPSWLRPHGSRPIHSSRAWP